MREERRDGETEGWKNQKSEVRAENNSPLFKHRPVRLWRICTDLHNELIL